jgi:uncharacterized protein (TIGR03437 family)
LSYPDGVAVDSSGNLYIADYRNNRIRKVSKGVITTVAGDGREGLSGDNGPATSARLSQPNGIAVDSSGNLYIADTGSNRIRKISNGVITTVAGNGTPGFSGDNGPATSAQLHVPKGIAVDSSGNLYIADTGNIRIRKVSNGVITTVAGAAINGFGGDNGPATSAQLSYPEGVAVDSNGNLYIADYDNARIRRVSNGVITTVAGTATYGFSGDNGPATSAQLSGNDAVAVDPAGNLYISDIGNRRIRRVSNGVITTVVGGGTSFGAGGPATSSHFSDPSGVAVDSSGNLYIAASADNRILKVSNGIITTVAGNGTSGGNGDNGPATSAQLNNPLGVALDHGGNLYIADYYNSRIRKVSNGVITTVAGNGTSSAFSGDDGPATSAALTGPNGVAVDAGGNLYISEVGNNRIRKVSNGVITTVAGNGARGFSGDNGPATSAQLAEPSGVAVDSAGNLYIADAGNFRIRKVSNGMIATVAVLTYPSGIFGIFGNTADGVAVDSAGNVYVADFNNNLVGKVSNGTIAIVAGGGTAFGDGGPATGAQLSLPSGVALDSAGNVYVADGGNNRIRVLTPTSCTYSITPSSLGPLTVGPVGGNFPLSIQTTTSCSWSISGLPSWATVSGSSSGSGPATFNLTVAPNAGALRNATILIAGMPLTVSQASGLLLITTGGAVSSANFTAPVVPGSISAIFGNFPLASPISVNAFPIPTSLGGLSFQFGSASPVPLFYANLGQVNGQVPWELAGQTQTSLTATINGQTSVQAVSLATYAPGIFTVNSEGTGQGSIQDASYRLISSTNPTTAGAVIQIYCTGLGPVTNQPATGMPASVNTLAYTTTMPTVTIGGVSSTVQFAGLTPGEVGLYQVNAQVPQGTPKGSSVPVTISIGGVVSHTVTIAVQ